MQQEESLSDDVFAKKMERQNIEDKLGGAGSAYQGALKLAQNLKGVQSKYPLVVLTNDPKLLAIDHNDTKKQMYQNVVIKRIDDGDWLKHKCQIQQGNGLHY